MNDRRARCGRRGDAEPHQLSRTAPGQLSGGQRQRVAIGRAIVRQPSAFLFDEPLSNLDAALRGTMRLEISELHHQLATTMIYVTHDQVEAMTMADKIVVLNAGNIEQVGSPLDLYKTPKNLFVARVHRLAEDEPRHRRGSRQARRGDHRHPARAYQAVDHRRRTWKGRSVSRSISALTRSCTSRQKASVRSLRAADGEFALHHGDTVWLTPDPPSCIDSTRREGDLMPRLAGKSAIDHRFGARHRPRLRGSLCARGRDGRHRRHRSRRAQETARRSAMQPTRSIST
jgi:ABC-type proline/glycine betaine transport system ATPase subunit